MRPTLIAVALGIFVAGCAGEPRERELGVCSPKSAGVPCASAQKGLEYPFRLYTHCGAGNAYFAGRWWTIEPPQPVQANWIDGVMTLVDARLADFRSEGLRFDFAPAPPSFEPPPCY